MAKAAIPVRIRCPACGKVFRASSDIVGRLWACKRCDEPFIAEPLSGQTWRCDVCGDAGEEPTRAVEYGRLIGLVVLFHIHYLRGNLCRDCRKERFSDYTLLTAAFGWLGFPSCLIAPFVVLGNVISHARASATLNDASVVRRVRGPAGGLLAVALAHTVFAVSFIIAALFGDWASPQTWVLVGLGAWGLLVALVVHVGTCRMRKLRSLGLSRAVAVLAMLAPLPSAILALPCGIWALVVLRQAEVVKAFRLEAAAGGCDFVAPADGQPRRQHRALLARPVPRATTGLPDRAPVRGRGRSGPVRYSPGSRMP
jgi:hypothetical protein